MESRIIVLEKNINKRGIYIEGDKRDPGTTIYTICAEPGPQKSSKYNDKIEWIMRGSYTFNQN